MENLNLQSVLNQLYVKNKDRINNPLWKIVNDELVKEKYVHDFERYIPDSLKHGWNNLSIETKTALFMTAQEAADNEEWN